jgi:hypothetical protein
MNKKHSLSRLIASSVASLLSLYLITTTQACADPTPGAEVVRLRQNSCGTDTDCFTDINTLLNWTWNTRLPTSANPLLIDAGPGTFQITQSYCSNSGYVTLRGSGRGNTTITATSNVGGGFGGIVIDSCKNLTFQNLTFSTAGYSVFSTIFWNGGGDSSWTDVAVNSSGYAWYDAKNGGGCAAAAAGKHSWFASTLTVNNTSVNNVAVYRTECGDTGFWGSSLVNSVTSSNQSGSLIGIDASSAGATVHLYGSNVQVLSKASTVSLAGSTLTGLLADGSGAVIHIHGSEVSVQSQGTADLSVVGASAAGTNTLIHGHQTNWGLLPSGVGTATRLIAASGAKVQAPFDWTPGTLAPTPGDATGVKHILSSDGQDRFVETDCPQTGGCQTAGSFPHTMVYRAACTGTGATQGPWFDTVTNQCRGI